MEFHIVALRAAGNPLVVVVNRYRKNPLGLFLTDDVLIKNFLDFFGFGDGLQSLVQSVGKLFFYNLIAQLNTVGTDIHTWTGNELFNVFLRLAAEGTLQLISIVTVLGHL